MPGQSNKGKAAGRGETLGRLRIRRPALALAGLAILVSGARADGLLDRLSLRVSPGGLFSLGGSYSDTQHLRTILHPGAGLGVGLRVRVGENFHLDLGYDFAWLSVKKDARPFAYKETHPALNLQAVTVSGVLSLASGYRIEPYLVMGAGLYPWRFSAGPLWGEAWPAPGRSDTTFSNLSLGLDFGFGLESFVSSRLSAFLEARYIYIFARDPDKFGTDDFTQQDFVRAGVGITFRLSRAKK
jgi:opacity protein-like surface antigen